MIINRVDVPYDPPDKPTVYAVVTGRWRSGDISGSLMLPDGELVWGHTSSSIDWLVHDLTISFLERREELAARFGDDIDVAVIENWAGAPSWLRARNEEAVSRS